MKSYQLNYKNAAIVYYSNRNTQKETLLFLHPAFSSSQVFNDQFQHFNDNYNLLAIDMPGHGATKTKGHKVTFRDIDDIIDLILKKEGIKKVHIIGVSLGSLVAQYFAEKYPVYISSVTIVGGYSIHKEYKKIIKAQRKEQMKWIPSMIFPNKERFAKKIVADTVCTETGKEKFLKTMSPLGMSTFMSMDGANSLFIDKAEMISYPLLALYGDHESEIALYAAELLKQLEPGAIVQYVEGAGHCIHLDQPNIFNETIQTFIMKH